MGKVLTVLRVSPAEGQDPQQLAERVGKVNGCAKSEVVDWVFGAKVVRARLVCEDAAPVDFEELVRGLEGVDEVQVEETQLV